MIGYIGERARRKKRNTILIFILIVIGVLIFLIFPKIQLNESIPSDTLLPSEEEILTPEFKKDTEELELQIFQKEQKIIFRDQQINKLQKKIEILTDEKNKLSETIDKQFANTINQNLETENSKEKIKKIQLELQQKIEKLNQEIETTKKDYSVLSKSQKENVNEKNILKKEFKSLFNKNMKLDDENIKLADENKKLVNRNKKSEILIQVLEQQIREQETLIKKLEDTTHH